MELFDIQFAADEGQERAYSPEEFRGVLRDRVNLYTGEAGCNTYEILPYKHDNAGDYRSIAPSEFTSKEQMERFLSGIDKRSLVTFNQVRRSHDEACGRAERNGKRPVMSVSQYNLMLAISSHVQYQNIIITTNKQLARWLDVKTNHLRRKLQKLGNLVEVYDYKDGMKFGQIKLLVSPAYLFRHRSPKNFPEVTINSARQRLLSEWMRGVVSDDWLLNPDNHDPDWSKGVERDWGFVADNSQEFQCMDDYEVAI